MPSKIQLDENLWFLYTCLKSSDFKTIDFGAVGDITGLKATAARMRYARLRKQIENGTLIGTRGTPFVQLGNKKANGKRKAEEKEIKVKAEPRKFEELVIEDDSEDEKPLSKRRGIKAGPEKQENLQPQGSGQSADQQTRRTDPAESCRVLQTPNETAQPFYWQRNGSGKPEDFRYMAPYQAQFATGLQEQAYQAINWGGTGSWNSSEGQYLNWI